jgi:pyridoxal phosphate enzyme (YggS family)
MPPAAAIAEQLEAVRRRITAAAQRARRDPSSIALIAVAKTFPVESILEAVAAGQFAFGENRVQEAFEKIDATADLGPSRPLEWHLIGHLQSNKARKAAARFAWIHSIDSIDLVGRLDAAATEAGTTPRVLVQVDLAGESTKHGAAPHEVGAIVRAAVASRALSLRGLMVVPPVPVTAEDSRPWFRQLRALRDTLVAEGIPISHMGELSMGMSHDLDVAIDEGATMVRIGTAIFGGR